jgi:hypothetical protein
MILFRGGGTQLGSSCDTIEERCGMTTYIIRLLELLLLEKRHRS